jgi:phage shock protein B
MLGWLGIGAAELALLIPLAAVVGGVIIAFRAAGNEGSKSSPAEQAEDARLIQDMHRTLTKMEQRVEALETLLMDRELERNR